MKIGIIGGSGLDDPKILENFLEIEVSTPFGRPAGKLTLGKIGQTDVVILARHGKDHSIMPTNVPYRANIWALKEQGCAHIIATTACGSLREEIAPGDLVFLDQFVDFTKHRNLTFFDGTLPEKGVVHAPMAEPFDVELRLKIIKEADLLKLKYHAKGTVITIEGPRFSTKAESHLFRSWNIDVINMSTVPEVVLANELGIPYQAVAMSTDYDCWKEGELPVTWEMILDRIKNNADNVKKLIINVCQNAF